MTVFFPLDTARLRLQGKCQNSSFFVLWHFIFFLLGICEGGCRGPILHDQESALCNTFKSLTPFFQPKVILPFESIGQPFNYLESPCDLWPDLVSKRLSYPEKRKRWDYAVLHSWGGGGGFGCWEHFTPQGQYHEKLVQNYSWEWIKGTELEAESSDWFYKNSEYRLCSNALSPNQKSQNHQTF